MSEPRKLRGGVKSVHYDTVRGYNSIGEGRVKVRGNRTEKETRAQFLRLAQGMKPKEGQTYDDIINSPEYSRLSRVFGRTMTALAALGKTEHNPQGAYIVRRNNRR